jgi:hypothetical protein
MFACQKCNKCFFYTSYYIEHTTISSDCEVDSISELIKKYSPAVTCKACKKTFECARGFSNHKKKCQNVSGDYQF